MRRESLNKQPAFYIFGDSIAFGQHVDISKIWGVQLAQFLQRKNHHYILQLTAVNGETSTEAIKRLDYCVLSHNPESVWVQYGLNDANYWVTDKGRPRVEQTKFAENLYYIRDELIAAGVNRVFFGTNHIVAKLMDNPFLPDAYINNAAEYNNIIRDMKDNTKCFVVDIEKYFREIFSSPLEYLLPDGVHLNEKGHTEFAKKAIQEISLLL